MKVQLKIEGMDCGGCVRAVQNVLSGIEHVQGVDVKLETGEAAVTGGAGIDTARLVTAVEDAGYGASIASIES